MKDILTLENERAYLYRFLSECYRVPNEVLIETLICRGDLTRGPLAEAAVNIPKSNDLELLKVDYAKLFVGPYKLLAPPYGSVYLDDGGIISDSIVDVRRWYRNEGLELIIKESPDHISVELEFMYFLVFKKVQAICDSDSEIEKHYRKKQRSFFDAHLGMWVPEFTRNIAANAETEFYKALARLTESLIKKENAIFN